MLDDRKKKILNAVVDLYTQTGEPVGSKVIAEHLDITVSSATVRKEMSDLTAAGYLCQPHTSAGRVPSDKGYRMYLDSIMIEKVLNDEEKEKIKKLFPKACEPDKLLEKAGQALADLTNCAVFTSSPSSENASIRKVEVVSMAKRAAMLVIVTSTGIIKTRFCYGFSVLTPDFCEEFSEYTNDTLCGVKLTDINSELLNKIAKHFSEHILIAAPILSELAQLIEEASKTIIKIEGEANLFNHDEFDGDSAKGIIEALSKEDVLSEIVKTKNEVLSVLIGEETSYYELKGACVMVHSYKLDDDSEGQIGIIGPTRMNYPEMISNIDYFAKVLGEIYGKILEE